MWWQSSESCHHLQLGYFPSEVYCIVHYTRNEHGRGGGTDLLLKFKLYLKMKQTVKQHKYLTWVAYCQPSLTDIVVIKDN